MKQLTLRSVIIGVAGLIVVTASSMYVALRLGALPWPTVFVTVLSMTLLSGLKGSTINEINVCHTLMSAGAMVAGGIAFTLPGIWMANPDAFVSFRSVLAVTVAGALLGTVFSAVYRPALVDSPDLVYPIGHAAYDTLVAGLGKGRKALKLFLPMLAGIVFTLLRDSAGLIPAALTLFAGSAVVEPVTIWLSPMAFGIGSILDSLSVVLWFAGMVFGYFILEPAGIGLGLFAGTEACGIFRQNLGVGIMLGSGIGLLVKSFAGKGRNTGGHSGIFTRKAVCISAAVSVFTSLMLSLLTEISFPEAVVACIGIAAVSLVSGVLTGQSGINPMEIFAMIITVIVAFFFRSSQLAMFLIAGMVAAACGLAGDVMNDFKSGSMLRTDPKSQVAAEAIGGVLGAVVAAVSLFVIKKAFGSFGTAQLPAPQAAAVAAMLGGFGKPVVLTAGAVIGAALTFFGPSAATLGLGLYISPMITIPICAGSLIALICRKCGILKDEDISLISSGLLGGEGITGVVSAIISMFTA